MTTSVESMLPRKMQLAQADWRGSCSAYRRNRAWIERWRTSTLSGAEMQPLCGKQVSRMVERERVEVLRFPEREEMW